MDEVLEALLKECEVEYLRGSGPGGQHRNKVETGVRLRHVPSGLVAQATERRSRTRNMDTALERLRAAVEKAAEVPAERVPTRVPRRAVRARLAGKRKASEKKAARRPPDPDDG